MSAKAAPVRSSEFVVVGAGLSGLAAATTLQESGANVLVLEARDRVGGRGRSVRLDDGTVVELGGQWIGAAHHRLIALGERHGARTFRQHASGHTVIRVGGRTVRVRGQVPFRLGPVTLVALGVAVLRLDWMARQVAVAEPWAAARARAWDAQTLESWISRNVRPRAARAVFGSMLRGIFAADPGDVSLLHALTYIHAGGGLQELTGTVGAAQDACFAEGVESLADAVAERLDPAPLLAQPVRRIRHGGAGVVVETDRLRVDAQRVIVAIPPTLAGRIDYAPPLPGARDQLTQRVPQGSAIKCIAVYDEPFWRASGHSGLVLDTDALVSMVIDGTAPDAAGGVLVGFVEGGHARHAAQLAPDARRAAVLECFAAHFGAAARSPRHYCDQAWAEEEFTRGCYAGTMPPGAWTGHGRALRAPVGRIHWAGTETATEAMGYFEGALEAGERAAREALAAQNQGAG